MASSLETLALQKRAVAALERIADALQPQIVSATQMPGNCPTCGAPDAKQVDASSLHAPHMKKCLVCQTEYAG